MSKNKILLSLVTIALIAFFLFLTMRPKNEVEKQVTEAVLILKQGDDRSRDCEAFKKLVALSPESKNATLVVAEMYARGMCSPFDLQESIAWYKKAELSDEKIGQALFIAALWEIPASNKVGPSKAQVMSILQRAKELGYIPTKNEIERLTPEYDSVFK